MRIELKIRKMPEPPEVIDVFLFFPLCLRNGNNNDYRVWRWLERAKINITKGGSYLTWADEWVNCGCHCDEVYSGVCQSRVRKGKREIRCTQFGQKGCAADKKFSL